MHLYLFEAMITRTEADPVERDPVVQVWAAGACLLLAGGGVARTRVRARKDPGR